MAKLEEQFNVRVPKELKEWVRSEAEKQDRSMNYVAVQMLKKGRKAFESGKPEGVIEQ